MEGYATGKQDGLIEGYATGKDAGLIEGYAAGRAHTPSASSVSRLHLPTSNGCSDWLIPTCTVGRIRSAPIASRSGRTSAGLNALNCRHASVG